MENNNLNQPANFTSNPQTKSTPDTPASPNLDFPENPMELIALVDQFVTDTASETQKMIERTTAQVGETLQSISNHSIIKFLRDIFGAEWLMTILGEVDIEKIEANLAKLREEYPDKNPEELAQQIMLEKAWEGGKVGLITNIIPPIAAAMIGIELVATAKLQAEMVYEIAGAHGLDLREPARRGEVLAIFGLSLGTGALKAGVSFVEIIPGIGAVVGASTNAILLYALGYTACQFYAGKYKYFSPTITTDNWQQERESYWESALTQSRIMDEILVHMILASYPEKQSWEEILRTLEEVSPSSVKVVATKLENPQPLKQLLDQLSPNFASLTLSRCYYLAQLDDVITPQEQKILDALATKFNLDLASFNGNP